MALGPGAEFDRIRQIERFLAVEGHALDDDCALIPTAEGFFALSTDVSVERVHFRLDWIGLNEAGWRATAAALSDLAAEGAQPVGVLSAVTMPAASSDAALLELMKGVREAAVSVGAALLGGDLSSGPVWSVAVTALGWADSPVTRGGAKPGDGVWVTGELGGSRAALEAWRDDRQPEPRARNRYARPAPRIAAGQWLANHGARAMIDLSDGLGGDAGHLAAASGVALEIDLGTLPVAPEAAAEATRRKLSPPQFAAEGGEDFELLVALPVEFAAAPVFTRETGIALTRIGAVVRGQGARFSHRGRSVVLKGFNHFG